MWQNGGKYRKRRETYVEEADFGGGAVPVPGAGAVRPGEGGSAGCRCLPLSGGDLRKGISCCSKCVLQEGTLNWKSDLGGL